MTAVQSEYSLWTRDPEPEVLPDLRRARHRVRAVQPARQGLPHRHRRRPRRSSPPATSAAPSRASPPRTSSANQALVDHVRSLAARQGRDARAGRARLAAGPAAVDRADPRHPPPRAHRGERRRDAVALSADEVADLDALAARIGVRGDRYNDAGMAMVGL